MKAVWLRIKDYCELKLFPFFKKVIGAIGRFLKYAYASEITVVTLGIYIYTFHSKFIGIPVFLWGLLLAFNEYKEQTK